MEEEITVCVFCEKRIWKDTDGWRHESSGSMPICNSTPEPKTTITCPQCEGIPDMCNGYCEGTGKVTANHAAEWHRQNPKPQKKTLCINCGEPVHRTTAEERQGLVDPHAPGWKHDDGYWFCGPGNDRAEGPKEGKTLADFADSGKAFKRPHHALVFAFMETSGFLKEFDIEEGNPTLARLTAEDLTATDWQEVTV